MNTWKNGGGKERKCIYHIYRDHQETQNQIVNEDKNAELVIVDEMKKYWYKWV